MRQEQLAGTLESLLMTPTAPATIQIGTVAYDIVYVPLRTSLFLLIVAVAFGLDLEPSGIAPALIALLAFIPFVWGLGLVTAATMLTYRRGIGVVGFAATGMALTSGAYFPLELLPEWLTSLFQLNPMTITINAMREGLLAGISWSELGAAVAKLAPMSAASLSVGVFAFRLAMRRERRRGSLGLY
jgi:ABC-2 type transport system permease protein